VSTESTRTRSEPLERPPLRAGLRLQLVLALGALTLLAFVPLFLAVASLTRHTLRANREEVARALGRAVAGRLADDVAAGRDDPTLRDVALVSLDSLRTDNDAYGEGVVAVRIERPSPKDVPIEVGHPPTLVALRTLARDAPYGERTEHTNVEGGGPIVAVSVASPGVRVQVALRVGDQASRAAPLLRLVAFYTAAFAVVLLVFAYLLLTRLIVRPIAALVQSTRRLEAGTSRRIDASQTLVGAAEVAELGGVIARTTTRLVEREEALAAKVRQLEAAKAELIAARDAIVRTERLASVGRLSAGLAHEVGNPIAALLGLEDVVLTGELDAETRDLVSRMKRETERVHRVMRDLLDFARAGQEPAQSEQDAQATCTVREVVDEVVALVGPQRALRDIELLVEVDAGLPPVRMSGNRLQQVLLNLVMNAADAIGDSARNSGGDSRGVTIGHIALRARRDEGPHVRIEVEDDGPGIAPEVAPNLFEPFVTTKDVGKGTGLGLAVCRGLVEGVGGTIVVESGELPGACFVLKLPTPEAPPRPRSVVPPPVALRPSRPVRGGVA
jgi:two-component system NtrC family sensor kinase